MLHFFEWIILGLIAGFIASKLVNKTGSGVVMDIVIGVVGAIIGGFAADKLGLGGLEGLLNPWTILLAVLGSVVVLVAYRAAAARA